MRLFTLPSIARTSLSRIVDKEIGESDKPTEIIDVEEQVESEIDESMNIGDKTFINPSQEDKVSDSEMLKCKKCNFHSSTRFRLLIHKESYHNSCSSCYSTFKDQEKLRNHIKTTHSKK